MEKKTGTESQKRPRPITSRSRPARLILWTIVLSVAPVLWLCAIGSSAARAQDAAARPNIDAWLGEQTSSFTRLPGERSSQVKPEQLYLGLSIPYQVELENCGDASPTIQSSDDFSIQPTGKQETHIATPSMQRVTTTYSYTLTPLRTGQLTAPIASITVDGQTLTGPELKIDVKRQDRVKLEVAVTPSAPVLMQEVTATLSVYIKALTGNRYAQQDPLRVIQTNTRSRLEIQIPWLTDAEVPQSFQPVLSRDAWINENTNSQRRGFQLNNWVKRRPMASGIGMIGPMIETPVCYSTAPRRVFLTDEDGVEAAYWRYDISRRFIAKQLGDFTLSPCRLSGGIPMIDGSTGRLRIEEIGAVGLPVEGRVRDVPLAGRPDSYIDAVGQFTIDARLTPHTLRLGEKMTFTLSLRGSGTLAQIRPPSLEQIPGIADNFKVFLPPGDELADDARIFSFDVKPLRTDVTEFPSISVSYFDPRADRYVVVETPKFDITVEENTEVHVAGAGGVGGANDIQLNDKGIFMEAVDATDVGDYRVRAWRWLAALLVLVSVYAIAVVGTIVLRRQSGNVAGRRRRAASGQARTRLIEARRIAGSDPRAAAEHVREAIVGLIADMLNLPKAAMTPGDVHNRLGQCGADQRIIDQTRRILEACDGARYGATDATIGSLIRDAQTLLVPLTKQLRAAGNGK